MKRTRNPIRIGSLEELSKLGKKNFIEVNVNGKIRKLVYYKSQLTKKGKERVFFGKTGNPNYAVQFVVREEQIDFASEGVVFKEPYEKSFCNKKEGCFSGISYILEEGGL